MTEMPAFLSEESPPNNFTYRSPAEACRTLLFLFYSVLDQGLSSGVQRASAFTFEVAFEVACEVAFGLADAQSPRC